MRTLFALALCLVLSAAAADAAATKETLTPELRQAVGQAERYLNGITTIRARFIQVGPNGELSEGNVYLARPGRMRIEYDPPVPLLLIAADSWLTYQDKELEEATYLPLSSTPAAFLLEKEIRLGGKITVAKVEKTPGALRLRLIETDDPKAGALTLVFGEAPFALRQWEVTDAQGLTTRVGFLNAEFGVAFDSELFNIKNPYRKSKPGPRRY